MFFQNLVRIKKKSDLRISIVGGSNSVMRRGYAKYLKSYLSEITAKTTFLKYYSLGGVPSIYGLIQQDRHDIAAKSDLIFFEYRGNDRYAIDDHQYSLELSANSVEGFIRKAQQSNPNCIIVLIIFGTNLAEFYHNSCPVIELYESIGQKYHLPVVNLTKVLSENKGIEFVKSLYDQKDHAHYTRPYGVKIVSQAIVNELNQLGIIDLIKSPTKKKLIPKRLPIYADNFKDLRFLESFETEKHFLQEPKVSVYQNTVFKEKNYTIYPGNSLNFYLKGKLLAFFIKSDLNDGFVKIIFGTQEMVTSSHNSWVNKIKPQNVINLISLPLRRFEASTEFTKVSLSVCPEYPDKFELDYNKIVPPKKDPNNWKVSIIGVAYIGELKSIA
jgi:hypothetical protein